MNKIIIILIGYFIMKQKKHMFHYLGGGQNDKRYNFND